MITAATTSVWVRVDLATMRVIGVSDEPSVSRPGRPIFQVSANFDRLDYYVVEKNASAPHGITVRAANAAERTAADEKVAALSAQVAERTKKQTADAVREFYSSAFNKRFMGRGFDSMEELKSVALYTGTDTLVADTLKPLAVSILNAKVEWCQTVGKPVVTDILSGTSTVNVDEAFKKSVEDALDTFLTDKGFNIATYAR